MHSWKYLPEKNVSYIIIYKICPYVLYIYIYIHIIFSQAVTTLIYLCYILINLFIDLLIKSKYNVIISIVKVIIFSSSKKQYESNLYLKIFFFFKTYKYSFQNIIYFFFSFHVFFKFSSIALFILTFFKLLNYEFEFRIKFVWFLPYILQYKCARIIIKLFDQMNFYVSIRHSWGIFLNFIWIALGDQNLRLPARFL